MLAAIVLETLIQDQHGFNQGSKFFFGGGEGFAIWLQF